MFRTYTTLCYCCLLISSARGQLLPDVPVSHVPIVLEVLADDLPATNWVNVAGNTFRFGPTDLAAVPGVDDRVIVTAHDGEAFVINTHTGAKSVLLDLANPNHVTFNEFFRATPIQGLTTIAFHPEYNQLGSRGFGKFYTIEPETVEASLTVDFADSIVRVGHHQEAVYEYTMSDLAAMSCAASCVESKRELMRVDQPGQHHNLGDLLFSQEGLLFISSSDGDAVGEGPSPHMVENAQMNTNVYGTVLRIDPFGSNSQNGKYGVPADNPFVDGPGGIVDEIYAYGYRNPYRLAFSKLTGKLYASETGQNKVESIKEVTKGGNYGWPFKEGSFVFDHTDYNSTRPDIDADENGVGDVAQAKNLIDPVIEYGRQSGYAVIGLAAYDRPEIPEFYGKLIFGDFSFGKLYFGDPSDGRIFEAVPTGDVDVPGLFLGAYTDNNGELYLIGLTENTIDGTGVLVRVRRSQLAGDFDADEDLDLDDLEALRVQSATQTNDALFDLTGDPQVDFDDLSIWVRLLKNSYVGDANLDGEFNSSDLVSVFQASEYEDAADGNSTWISGDWNGDGDFTSRDFVVAFQDSGFEKGPRSVMRVPEPKARVIACFLCTMFPMLIKRVRYDSF